MKSLLDVDKLKKDKDKIRLYDLALNNAINEGRILWQSSQAFLVANTVIAGFISQTIFNDNHELIFKSNLGIFFLAIIGLLLTILWYGSYERRSNYYKFRVAQARQREPDNWNLVRGDGKYFSEGDTIEITVDGDKEKYNLGIFGKIAITNIVMRIFIVIFLILFLCAIVISGPWNTAC
jgi:hypothetical protein